MKKALVLGVLATALIAATPAPAIELGDPAPALDVAEWVKGGPVDIASGKGKNVFVIEFWATWCGPCRRSIPHLSEVAKAYADKGVVIVGISEEPADTVKPFVEKMGDDMAYNVAVDNEKRTSNAYMRAFGAQGIPHAFVIDKNGAIVWQGHPMQGLESVLDKVLAGSFNPEDAARNEEIRELMRVWVAEFFIRCKFGFHPEEADAAAAKLIKHADAMPDALNQVAWMVLTQDELKYRNPEVALKLAKAANDAAGGKNAAIIDTYARALFETGNVQEAIAQQKKAIGLAGDADEAEDMKKALAEYEAKAQ